MDGGCRHVVATLFEVMEFLNDQNKQSVTSQECLWIKRGNRQADEKAIPVTQLNIQGKDDNSVQQKDACNPVNEGERLPDPPTFFIGLKQISPHSCILHAVFKPDDNITKNTPKLSLPTPHEKIEIFYAEKCMDRGDLTALEHFNELLDYLSYSPEEISIMDKESEGQHENPNWHLARKGLITASKVKLIYACRDNNKMALNLMKGSTLNEDNLPEPIKFGRKYEQKARDLFLKSHRYHHHKCTLRVPGLVVSDTTAFLGASPDGIVSCKHCGKFLIEVKCFHSNKNFHPRAAMLCSKVLEQGSDGTITVNKKHQYYFQIQAQMAVTGIRKCSLVGYTHKGIHTEDVNFDSQFWADVVDKLFDFYRYHYLPLLVG